MTHPAITLISHGEWDITHLSAEAYAEYLAARAAGTADSWLDRRGLLEDPVRDMDPTTRSVTKPARTRTGTNRPSAP